VSETSAGEIISLDVKIHSCLLCRILCYSFGGGVYTGFEQRSV
jgi:hypothetical protein